MRVAELTITMAVSPMSALAMPPNCEVLARSYVGNTCHGLLRDAESGSLYLTTATGFWLLDVPQLVAAFAAEVRAWDRERGWLDGKAASDYRDNAGAVAEVARERDSRSTGGDAPAVAATQSVRAVGVQRRARPHAGRTRSRGANRKTAA